MAVTIFIMSQIETSTAKKIESLGYNVIILRTYAELENALRKIIPDAVIFETKFANPSYIGEFNPDFEPSIKLVKKIKDKKTNKPIIINADIYTKHVKLYFKLGADYYIPFLAIEKKEILTSIMKYLFEPGKKTTLYQDERIKSRFYNEASRSGALEERSRITAHKWLELAEIKKLLKDNNCKEILDAGCGEGRLAIPLAQLGYNVTGIDISDVAIQKAKRLSKNWKNPTFIQASIFNMPFKENSFDAVILGWHVICEFGARQEEAIKRIYEVLKPNGLFIFDFPDREASNEISKEGEYISTTPFGIYVGFVPEIKSMMDILLMHGFYPIIYKRLKWGIHKFFVYTRKM